MRNTPSFGEAVAGWFRAVNGEGRGRRVSLNALSDQSGVARTTLYRIEAGGGADQETLTAIAGALGVPAPVITKALQLEPGTLQEPRNAPEWVAEAQAALDRAQALLRGQVSEPPARTDPMDEAERKDRLGAKGPKKPRRRKAG